MEHDFENLEQWDECLAVGVRRCLALVRYLTLREDIIYTLAYSSCKDEVWRSLLRSFECR